MSRFKTALVAGASGSGKTFIAKMFQQAYIHSMDDYFRPPFEKNEHGIPEWDKPSAVNFSEWITDYHRIKEAIDLGDTITMQKYHFGSQKVVERKIDGKKWKNIRWIVLEGIFALDQRLHHLADIKVFVEAPFSIRLGRRLQRDMEERSGDLMFVLMHSYYTEESYKQYILPQKQLADLVIPTYEVDPRELTE